MKISVLLIVCYVFVCCVTYKVFENQSPMTTIRIPIMMLPKEYMSGCSSDPDLNKCTLSRAKEENVVNPPVKPTIKKKCASSFNTFSLCSIPKKIPINKQPIRFAVNVPIGY